uniref:Adiponectin receptor 2 n=1 Tax=Rattus norvegicus TaxID=10116 RepID=A0ABK0LNX4_RAT
MNEPTEHRLGCTRTPEPDIRLRKGHQLDDTRGGNNDNHHGDLEPSLETPVCSSYYENSPEELECHDDNSQEDEGFMGMSPLLQAHHAMERMEEFVCKVWEGRWRVIPHDVLPDWLKDNDFLLHGHRPPMPSFRACFKSIFRIHTETGNIWTHLLGCVFFLCLGIFYMFRPNISFVAPLQEKVVFGLFFLGAILCLSFSWLFHTVYCHSEGVSRLFSKLDYSGIALLIMGSFVPWLYYSFYCNPQPCFIYLIVICVLGIAAIIVSQWDMFATPQYRGVRAGVFVGLGLSGIIPTLHYVISEGFLKAATIGQIGWLMLMASLYITGAALYAARIPERFFPGKCDIWALSSLPLP